MTGLYEIDAHLTGLWLLSGLAAFGLVIGILSGLFGVGGGFMVVPLLKLVFGIDYPLAVGSSLSFTIGTGAAGMLRHMRLGNVEFKTTLLLGSATVFGAIFGANLLEFLKDSLGGTDERHFTLLMHGLFVLVLLVTAWMVLRNPGETTQRPLLARLPLPPYVDLPSANLTHISLLGLFVLGLGIGVFKGLLGIGGGVLFVPALMVVVGLQVRQAIGTSLGVVLFGSIAGTIKYAQRGNVNLWIVMSLLVGSVVGVQIGVWACQKLHARGLRRWFVLLVLLVAAVLAVDFVRKAWG